MIFQYIKAIVKNMLIGAVALAFFSYGKLCSDDQRLFSHPLLVGEAVCLPNNPQRIVALDMGAAEMTLLSNRQLIATSNWLLAEMSVLTPEFSQALSKVQNVGYPANLEKMMALKPDLILAVGGGGGITPSVDAQMAQKIAPTVVANSLVYDDWKLSAEFWAIALNEEPLYQRLLTNYQMRTGEVKAALGKDISQTVSLISNSNYGKSLWLKNTPPAAVVADVGLSRPKSQDYDKDTAKDVYTDVRYPMISEERLDLVDADAIFVFGYPAYDTKGQQKEQRVMEKLRKNPLWNSLSAVKNDKVFYVGGHWWRCNSYILANRVLDDIGKHLTGKLPTTSALGYPLEKTQ